MRHIKTFSFYALLAIIVAVGASSFSNDYAPDGKVYLSKGLRADKDNAPYINSVLRDAKEGSTIVWKEGDWPVASPIIQNKTINWEGVENVVIYATRPTTILKITGGYKSIIRRINFRGSYSIWDGDSSKPFFDGIQISAIVRMENCTIRNVWGNGITVSSDILKGSGNASASRFDNIDITECRGHGMYFQGGDANQCGIYHADIRDCNGIGIYDKSYLGNQFFSCMTHNNKQGSYRAEDGNNRAGFYGCYAEQGQGPIYLAGAACWFGGLPSDGVVIATPYAKVYSYSTVEIKHL